MMDDLIERHDKATDNRVDDLEQLQGSGKLPLLLSRRTFLATTGSALAVFGFAIGARRSSADPEPFYVPGTVYHLPAGESLLADIQGVYRPIGLSIHQTSMLFSPTLPPENSVRRAEQAMIVMTFGEDWGPTDVVTLKTHSELVDLIQPIPRTNSQPISATNPQPITVNRFPKKIDNKVAAYANVGVPINSPNFITLAVTLNDADKTAATLAFIVVSNA